jgi:hypothetical protein
MPITGGIKFFDENPALYDNGGGVSASSGQVVANNCIDKLRSTFWTSVGSNDTTAETLTISFGSSTISRLLLLDHNWKDFTAKYWNGSAFADFTSVIGLDGSVPSTPLYAVMQSSVGPISVIDYGSSAFNPNYTDSWTVSAWLYTDLVYAPSILNSRVSGSTNKGLSILVNTNGSISVVLAHDVAGVALISINTSADLIPANTWKHVAVTYSGNGAASGFKVYVDGNQVSTTTLFDTLGGLSTVSTTATQTTDLSGFFTNLAIFKNHVENSGRIADLFGVGRNGDLSGLSSYSDLSYWYRLRGNANDSKGAHNATTIDVSYGPEYGIVETAFADDTSYYEFDPVTTTQLQIVINKTQVADAEKYIATVFPTTELYTLSGYPKVTGATLSPNARAIQMLSGRNRIIKQPQAFSVTLGFSNYPVLTYGADIDAMLGLIDRETPFYIWLCGGRRGATYFSYAVRTWRLKDCYRVQTDSQFSAEWTANLYKSGQNLGELLFTEHV